MRILVAEDDPRLLKSPVHILKVNKYSADGVSDGKDALDYAQTGEYDGLVLDIMMPGLDGIQVLKALRSKGITTPERLARIRAMLRRKENYTPDLLTFHELILNRSTYELIYQEKTQNLSGKEFQVLEMLMQNAGRIITTDQFITHIWGWDTSVDASVVWVHISNLRKKFDAVKAPVRIRFVRSAGYILEEDR